MVAKYRIETLDHDYLKERLRYDLLTGKFTWKKHPSRSVHWNDRYAGKEAGCVVTEANGYKAVLVRLDGRNYRASQLAWFFMLRRWPVGEIDHINHNSTDNKWTNIREVDSVGNHRNITKRIDNISGVMGVSWFKRDGNWRVYINVGGKQIHGGNFDSFEEACSKRKQLEAEYGFHENHGT